ncbi:translocation/assembly module TamB domain-containing protein [Roseivirga echinicomitans]
MCLSPIILLFIVIGLIHIPPVQNYLVDKATVYLTESTGYRSEIGYANIRWFNSVTIDELTIYDQNDVKMIDVGELVASFKLRNLIGGKNISINEAWLNNASVNLRNEGDSTLNINNWVAKITELTSTDRPASDEPPVFSIRKITLLNSEFSLSDARKDSITNGFDYNHFTLQNLRTDIRNLESVGGDFEINVQFLTAEDKASGLKIDKLETIFQTSLTKMAFTELDLLMGKSHLKDSIVFSFEDPSDMSEFITDVNFSANFKNSLLHSNELGLFVPEFQKYDQQIRIDGHFQGRVNSFYSENFTISFGENSKLNGRLDIEGLPNINETIFDIDLNDSFLKATDLRQFINERTFKITNKLGLIQLNGQYDGLINDFVADGEFKTALGNVNPNVQITLPENKLASYSGRLSMENFNVGVLTEDSIFQKVDLNGSIEGEGFTLEQANFKLDAKVSKIGILGYEYVDITTNGSFAQSFFSGEIAVDDPNLIFNAEGSVDLRNNNSLFKINGRLSRADLTAIKLTDDDIFIASDFNLDFEGVKLDSILGNFHLIDAYLKYGNEDILVDSVFFSSQRDSRSRTVMFNSDYFNINMNGQFEFSTVIEELKNINGQYKLVFSSRSNEIAEYLKTHGRSPRPFDITYSVDLPNINPIIQLFDSAIYVGKNASINGRFNNSNSEDFQLNARIDSLIYSNISFLTNEIDINAKSLRDPDKVLALGYLYSKKQIYANTSETDALTLEAVWDGKRIELRQNIEQTASGNYAEIGAGIDFFESRTELRFQESNIIALDKTWNITDNNVVVFGKDNISIENLDIYNDSQSITLDGNISVSRDTTQSLQIIFENVEVENLNTLTLKSYSGKINGTVNTQNLLYNPLIYGDINVNEFRIDDFLVGDVSGAILWNDFNKKFDINLEVDRLGRKIIQLNGDFYPSRKTNQLDLDLTLNEANLNIGEPYTEDYFTKLAGTISGQLTVDGTLSDPLLRGNGIIKNGGIKINYLNTEYGFSGGVKFDRNLISVAELQLRDVNGSPAQFKGEVHHNAFNDISLDLTGNLDRFQVLNTTVDNGDLYYGNAYATGNISLRGAASNLTINADVTTAPNTKIYIPISEGSDDTSVDYINFINLTDTTQIISSNGDEVEKMKIEGLKLDLNINITPDAYTEIIIDPKTGDIIRGKGNGQLRLQIDTQGDFLMTGGLNITEGAYNFSLYNIITKEFDIEQPSRITWSGDPYAGVMNINASYSQNTSLAPILKQTGFTDESNSVNRRYPTKVLLRLNGPLLSPDIDFDIDFSDITTQDFRLQTALNAFKNRLASDEQELTRQVVNVIVLNSFSDSNTLNIGGKSASQNVSQLLSNQLSQLVAQLDENLEIDFDLASLDQDAYNTFQLRLSYTFLNGRLRVTREGGLTNQVDKEAYTTDINSIAGDWTAEYLLTSDGRYKVKVYSRSNYNFATAAAGGSTNQTSGASITQSSSFNNLSEFFTGVDRKRKKRREENLAKKEEENNSDKGAN